MNINELHGATLRFFPAVRMAVRAVNNQVKRRPVIVMLNEVKHLSDTRRSMVSYFLLVSMTMSATIDDVARCRHLKERRILRAPQQVEKKRHARERGHDAER